MCVALHKHLGVVIFLFFLCLIVRQSIYSRVARLGLVAAAIDRAVDHGIAVDGEVGLGTHTHVREIQRCFYLFCISIDVGCVIGVTTRHCNPAILHRCRLVVHMEVHTAVVEGFLALHIIHHGLRSLGLVAACEDIAIYGAVLQF